MFVTLALHTIGKSDAGPRGATRAKKPLFLIEQSIRETICLMAGKQLDSLEPPLLLVTSFSSYEEAAFSLLPTSSGLKVVNLTPQLVNSLPPLSKVERGNERTCRRHESEWGEVQTSTELE